MKKEIYMLALTFFLAIFCAGCNSSKDSVSITKDETHSFVDDDLRIGDIRDIANTEKGFYYMNESRLFYYDNELKESTILCTDANCNHASDNCNACFIDYFNEIFYNNGNIYAMEYVEEDDSNYHFYLVEISKDATKRTRLTDLFQASDTAGISYDMVLHRGYCYFCVYPDDYETEKENSVFRVKIEKNAEVENIYTDIGYGVTFDLYGYENGIYLEEHKNIDSQASDSIHDMHIYNMDTEKVTDCEMDDFRQITFGNGCMYYTKSDSLWKKEDGKKEEKLYDFGKDVYGDLQFDGSYFYFDTQPDCYMRDLDEKERKVYVIDQQGELKEMLEIPFEYWFATCDKEKSVWKDMSGTKVAIYYTKQIGSGKTQLEEISQ